MNKDVARKNYEYAVAALADYCEKETELSPLVLSDKYPFCVVFEPNGQLTLLGDENVDAHGEVCNLTVTVGLTTQVKSTLKFRMESKQLKKLIRMAEKLGWLYYHAFREQAGDLREEAGDLDPDPVVLSLDEDEEEDAE